MRTILITGGAGFIGANLVNYLSEKYPEDRIIVLDILTYAGSVDNLPKDMLQGQHPLRRWWIRWSRRRTSSSTSPPRRTSPARSSTAYCSFRPTCLELRPLSTPLSKLQARSSDSSTYRAPRFMGTHPTNRWTRSIH